MQSGALSLVGIVEILLSLVESFIELKYFHIVATPALLCHKEPTRRIQSPLLGALERLLLAGSLWHKGAYNRTFPCMEATYPYKRAGVATL